MPVNSPPSIHVPQEEISLAYSADTDAVISTHNSQRSASVPQNEDRPPPQARDIDPAEQYAGQYGEFQYHEEPTFLQDASELNNSNYDATATVHEMYRKLLYLLSHHELFAKAIQWQTKVEKGLDPSKALDSDDVSGIRSFENEFDEKSLAADETKEDEANEEGETVEERKYKDQAKLIPPLPLQIFASDAEVVLPQALTASQLFGIERLTGIELEAAAGIVGLSLLFSRWLALMPEGDHMNSIEPPGLTVMRISGGRYRVTGAHRVVWRWMNKFSPASTFALPGETASTDETVEDETKDTDFDFGDLVSMTIIDVFETDADGKLLSYCPTFDNRTVHKTQETVERIRKGASQLNDGIKTFARSPAGKTVNKAAGELGKMAFNVGTIVAKRIEEEISKHHNNQHSQKAENSETVGLEDEEEQKKGCRDNDFSDGSTSASSKRMEV